MQDLQVGSSRVTGGDKRMCRIADECAAVAMAVRGAAFTAPAAAAVSIATVDKLLLDTLSHTRFEIVDQSIGRSNPVNSVSVSISLSLVRAVRLPPWTTFFGIGIAVLHQIRIFNQSEDWFQCVSQSSFCRFERCSTERCSTEQFQTNRFAG